VRFGGPAGEATTVTSAGGNPDTSAAIDPIANSDACKTVTASDDPGTAVVRSPKSTGFTLMGLPTVTATIATTGNYGQLDSRLWDVAPDGSQTLVSRGAYRLTDAQSGPVTFQLSGDGWRFAKDHVARLELLGRDAPYLRPSNAPFSVDVKDVVVELPTLEKPEKDGQIVEPILGLGKPLSAIDRAAACATSNPRALKAGRRGAGLRIAVPGSGPRTVDIRRMSTGRRIADRRVARLTTKTASVTWSGKGRAIRDGIYVAEVRGSTDVTRIALRRRHGRFTVRPAFQLIDTCGAVRSFALARPVLGGTGRRTLAISYRTGAAGKATVTVRKGKRVVARFKQRTVKAGTTYPLRLRAKGLPRGDLRVRLVLVSGGRTTTRTLTAANL
jgi:hypothetical protein